MATCGHFPKLSNQFIDAEVWNKNCAFKMAGPGHIGGIQTGIDSLLRSSTDSLLRCFIDSPVRCFIDWLIHRLNHCLIASFLQQFIDSFSQLRLVFSCHFIGISTAICSVVDASISQLQHFAVSACRRLSYGPSSSYRHVLFPKLPPRRVRGTIWYNVLNMLFVFMCVYIYLYLYIYVHMYMYVYLYICIFVSFYIYMYIFST